MVDQLYYAGIDGGGTKTKCVIAGSDGSVLATGVAGSSNPNYKGLFFACGSVLASLRQALAQLGLEIKDVKFGGICIGLSGAGPENRKRIRGVFQKYFTQFNVECAHLEVFSDALIAWHGAFNGNPGILVISGTGTIVYGRVGAREASSAAMNARISLLRGGGFHIGLYGAKLCLRDVQRGNQTILLQVVREAFEHKDLWPNHSQKTLEQLLQDTVRCFDKQKMLILSREDVAALAYFIDRAAEQDSTSAQAILHGTANQIAANVSYVANALGISGQQFKVAVVGSVIKSVTIRWRLKRKLSIEEPYAEIVEPALAPEVGALDIAIRNLYA